MSSHAHQRHLAWSLRVTSLVGVLVASLVALGCSADSSKKSDRKSNSNRPDAVDDTATTDFEEPVDVDVLTNDTDPNSTPLTVTSVSTPTSGTAVISSNAVTYTPGTGFSGTDTFTYEISNGTLTDSATVTVTVNANQDPDAVDDSETTAVDTPVTVDVLDNDSDPEGHSLTVTATTQPSDGMVTFTSTDVTYEPDTGFMGTDSFTYTIGDGNGGSDTATVTIDVQMGNSDPIGVDDTAGTAQDTSVVIDVLSNDTDPDMDPLTVSDIPTQALNGTATITSSGDDITYDPDAGFLGNDTFVYELDDGNGGVDTATVTVSVTRNPVAEDDTRTTPAGETGFWAVIGNDSDPDGDPIEITDVGLAANGFTDFSATTVRYDPDPGFIGTDSFTYTLEDGLGGMDTGTVFVTVKGARVLYGAADSGGESTLYTIDPADGSVEEIGGIGFDQVGGLVTDRTDGELYGTGFNGAGDHVLIQIDRLTGAGTEVGATGIELLGSPTYEDVSDLTWREADGTILGYALEGTSSDASYVAIDPATGLASVISPAIFLGDGNGLAIDLDPNAALLINAVGGQADFLEVDLDPFDENLGTAVDSSTAAFTEELVLAMEHEPATGLLYALMDDLSTFHLVTVDNFGTGVVDDLGTTTSGMKALSWGVEASEVAITEFINNPSIAEPTNEWIELFNYGQAPVDLEGWTLEDEDTNSTTLVGPTGSIIIPSGGYIILARDKTAFEAEWLGTTVTPEVFDYDDVDLGNGPDELVLKDPTGKVIWSLAYADDGSEGPATFLSVDDFSTKVFGSKASPGVVRDGTDSSGSLGYEDGTGAATDPQAVSSLNGDTGSPLDGIYTVPTP